MLQSLDISKTFHLLYTNYKNVIISKNVISLDLLEIKLKF